MKKPSHHRDNTDVNQKQIDSVGHKLFLWVLL